MDPNILAQMVGALLRWSSLGSLGSKTVRREVRHRIEGVQSADDARAAAVARARREVLDEMGAYLTRHAALNRAEMPPEDARALTRGLTESAVVKEAPFGKGDAQGVRIVVAGRVTHRSLHRRARRLLADKMQLHRLKVSEQRNDELLKTQEELEAANLRIVERGRPAEKRALQAAFRENTGKLQAQEWAEKLQSLWSGTEYTDARQAIDYINEAIKLVPDYPVYYFFRGNANYYWKQYEPALRDYDKAIGLNPDYAEAYNNRGNVYYQQNQHPRAVADYDAAVRLKPDYADAFNNRGNALYKQSQFERALTDYNAAIGLDPADPIYFNNRGITYDGLRDFAKAREDYDRAIALDPRYAVAYFNRGHTWETMERHHEALEDYQRAIRLDPRHAEAYHHRGTTYQKMGYRRAACREWRKAAKLGHPEARECLNRYC